MEKKKDVVCVLKGEEAAAAGDGEGVEGEEQGDGAGAEAAIAGETKGQDEDGRCVSRGRARESSPPTSKESGQDQRASASLVCGGEASHLGPTSGTGRGHEGGSHVDGHEEVLLGETGDQNPARTLGRGPQYTGVTRKKTDFVTFLFVCLFVDAEGRRGEEGAPTRKVAEVVPEQ